MAKFTPNKNYVIGSPYIQEDHFLFPDIEPQLMKLLPALFEGVYPRKIRNENGPKAVEHFWSLPKEERKVLFRERRKKMKCQQDLPNEHLKKHFSIGLQKCLREVQRTNLGFLMIDGDFDFQVFETLWSQPKCPVIKLRGMSSVVSGSLGFPASMIGLQKTSAQVRDLSKIVEIQALLLKAWEARVQNKSTTCADESKLQTLAEIIVPRPDVEPKRCAISEILLERTDKSTRVFRSCQNSIAKREDFGKDFLSFSDPINPVEASAAKKRKTNPVVYQSTKMIKQKK